MQTSELNEFDPDKDVYDSLLVVGDSVEPGEQRKEAERRQLAALRQKKFFAMDDTYLQMRENPYLAQVGRELE